MKYRALLLMTAAFTAAPVFAQWAVVDPTNLVQNTMTAVNTLEQLARSAEQISNQIQQIKHVEDQLARMGRMADFKSLVGFPELKLSISFPTQLETWSESVLIVDGYGLFGDTRDGIYDGVYSDFPDFDGVAVHRDPAPYKPAHEVTTRVNNFKKVQADVYSRREELKKAILQTSEALLAAETEAEEQKLEAILNAQYAQLAALDSEVALSAAEIQVQAAEADAMEDAQSRADTEARRKLAQQEAKKVTTAFTPTYKCLLQFVTEKPFSP